MGGLILLTGATGFLGAQIARLLLRDTDHRLVVLVRGRDEGEARRRLERVWIDWPETDGAVAAGRVRVLPGDLSRPGLGLDAGTRAELVHTLTHVVHAAAELKLDGDLEELRRINVQGTARLLELARAVHADHGLERYAHVSTAYVAGGRTGEVAEEELTDRFGFSNAYEQTKYEGELVVREAMRDLPVSVFRPGMVVGDSRSGEIRAFNTVYVPLRLYLSGRLRLIPARPELPLNLVPVDYVASSIARLLFDRRAEGLTFHLTVDPDHLPPARELLRAAREWAAEELGEAPPPARFVPLEALSRLPGAVKLPVPEFLLSYFSENRRFQRDNVERLLGPYVPDWAAILPRLLGYAVGRGFLHRSGRTVHEQVLYRLQSRRLPVRVHDLAADGSERARGGAELAGEIAQAAGALRALGIQPGDRVALVGLNSSRYLALDTAVGLTGAVSVPLYYTSPPREIEEILEASAARLFMIGAPEVLARLDQMRIAVPVASFCLGPLPGNLAGKVIPWGAFLALGREQAAMKQAAMKQAAGQGALGHLEPPAELAARPAAAGRAVSLEAPVGFVDLATLRFTSGTTGAPRGVAFRHDQLLWLAETLSALLPWRARTRPARYLSFLPMNHVVEGILGTYAPYCLPAPVDVWFLEDFYALARALPRVRPTVFFSVPRFYEKIWERFASGAAGSLYLGLPPGGLRRALRPLVRRALLRRAGLDRCAQLVVGSAPCPDRLTEGFRELGIEIHNAYGLTEAPLVTLNRHGANRLGTVGTPLPQTELRLAPDGEVLVRGPQVGGGEGRTGALLPGGWLATGDLGELTPDGGLVIRGRKKELLVTSYGKNIHPGKIEAALREIPEMAEAMVVGEGRPALCALLWLKGGSATPDVLDSVDRAVRRLNAGLSHPEQVKRWAVLSESPSIESGELTGNLKLRRQAVLARRGGVVEMLYRRASPAPEVLHVGDGR